MRDPAGVTSDSKKKIKERKKVYGENIEMNLHIDMKLTDSFHRQGREPSLEQNLFTCG